MRDPRVAHALLERVVCHKGGSVGQARFVDAGTKCPPLNWSHSLLLNWSPVANTIFIQLVCLGGFAMLFLKLLYLLKPPVFYLILSQVAEGVDTALALADLIRKTDKSYRIDLKYAIIFGGEHQGGGSEGGGEPAAPPARSCFFIVCVAFLSWRRPSALDSYPVAAGLFVLVVCASLLL